MVVVLLRNENTKISNYIPKILYTATNKSKFQIPAKIFYLDFGSRARIDGWPLRLHRYAVRHGRISTMPEYEWNDTSFLDNDIDLL